MQFAPKFVYLRWKIEKILQPPPQTPQPVGRGTPPPHTPPLGASILSSLRRSNSAFPQFFFKETTPAQTPVPSQLQQTEQCPVVVHTVVG